jgi:hypothetical protein
VLRPVLPRADRVALKAGCPLPIHTCRKVVDTAL